MSKTVPFPPRCLKTIPPCRDMPWHVRIPSNLIRWITPLILLKFLIYKETTLVTLAIDTENP